MLRKNAPPSLLSDRGGEKGQGVKRKGQKDETRRVSPFMRFHRLILILSACALLQPIQAQSRIQLSSRQEIYGRMQFPCDAVSATLRQDANMLRTFLSSYDRTAVYTGSLRYPWQVSTVHMHKDFYDKFNVGDSFALKHTAEYAYDFGSDRYHAITHGADNVNLVLKNIYKISSGELLGFLHVE